MRVLVDMNLPPQWVEVFQQEGYTSTHWSSVGAGDASDWELMQWARRHEHVVFTHDLDFSALLAATEAAEPSVIQIRTEDVLPSAHSDLVLRVLRQFKSELRAGAILSIDVDGARIRHLPMSE
jgi:predicted nuclease of predicted toxin-antitoxin system